MSKEQARAKAQIWELYWEFKMTMKNILITQKEKSTWKVQQYTYMSRNGGSENFPLDIKSNHHCYRQEE